MLPLVVMSALGSGCVANDTSITIDKFIPYEMDCSLKSDTDLIKLGGLYDAGLGALTGAPYQITFVVHNNLPTRDNIPIDTQAYFINSYDVELEINPADPAAVIPGAKRHFNVPSGSVRLSPDSKTPGIVPIPADVFSGIATDPSLPRSLINVRIRPVATRAEEQVVGAFSSFPLTVCVGCLSGTIPSCPLPKGTTPLAGGCVIANDAPVTCCKDPTTSALLCGKNAPVATM